MVEETRFENFWRRTFKQMSFREPISFMPYNLKIGYFTYGGDDYLDNWNNILIGENGYEASPFTLNNSNFPDIAQKKYRTGIMVELDLLRYNFFKKYQNIIDIQLGIGYKYNKVLENKSLNNINLQPNFQDANINSTFILQWDPKFFTYLYYSYGLVKAHFYESVLGDASGDGYNQGIGFGLNFISPRELRANNVFYGLELRFEKCKINDINEPNGLDFISSFHMEKIGLIFSFGVGYGGQASLGDESYKKMLRGDYLSALEDLQKFQNNNPYSFNQSKIESMMEICRYKIPYQLYDMSMENYYNNQLQDALLLLNKASYHAKDSLKFKIESQKYIIADEMLDKSEFLFKNYSIDDQITFFKSLDNMTGQVDRKIARLYLLKGDLYLNKRDYELAYDMYLRALGYDVNQENILHIKLDRMVTTILNDAYKFLQNKEYVIAYELLSFIKYIAKNNNISQSLTKIVKEKLENQQFEVLREKIKFILNKDKEFLLNPEAMSIYLGDDYFKVIEAIGLPNKVFEKKKINEEYEMLIYSINDIKYRLFFKNKILIDVERE